MPARMRIPSYAVWETVVFVLNVLAFVLIGLQCGRSWERSTPAARARLRRHRRWPCWSTVILARIAWVMAYNVVMQAGAIAGSARPAAPDAAAPDGAAAAWSSRGAACAASSRWPRRSLSERCRTAPFPYRDLILLRAFAVVLGTLVLQGLTLRPLIRALRPERRRSGRARGAARPHRRPTRRCSTRSRTTRRSPRKLLRKEYGAVIDLNAEPGPGRPIDEVPGGPLRRRAIAVARQRAFELRRDDVIGDDAYRVLVQELDWAELSAGGNRTD